MAENTGGDSVLDHLPLYPDIDSDWESYYIIAGIGIGLLDALPIFGTGTVLIPGDFLMLQQKWYQGSDAFWAFIWFAIL